MKAAVIAVFLLLIHIPCTVWCVDYVVVAGEKKFSVELATSQVQHRRGLMYRESLAKDKGLIMVFEEDTKVPIWMKNVRFPLDVIWLSAAGKVVDKMMLPLCSQTPCKIYQPTSFARYVLEVSAGVFPLNIGQKVEIFDASGDSLHLTD